MTDKRWEEIVLMIEDRFDVMTHEHADDEEDYGGLKGKRESISFTGPSGKMKIERVWKPLVVGKNVISSHRAGSHAQEEYKYSDTETSGETTIYRWDDDTNDWVTLSLENLFPENV